DLAPTILDFLNVTPSEAVQKEIDGIDLFQKVSAYDLQASIDDDYKLKVYWKAIDPGDEKTEIYVTNTNNFKTGGEDEYELVGTAALKDEQFTTKLELDSSALYKVVLKTPEG